MRPPRVIAISASTMFHGSVCCPGVQGTLPFGSCTDVIASIVSAICARVMTPGDLGELVDTGHRATFCV